MSEGGQREGARAIERERRGDREKRRQREEETERRGGRYTERKRRQARTCSSRNPAALASASGLSARSSSPLPHSAVWAAGAPICMGGASPLCGALSPGKLSGLPESGTDRQRASAASSAAICPRAAPRISRPLRGRLTSVVRGSPFSLGGRGPQPSSPQLCHTGKRGRIIPHIAHAHVRQLAGFCRRSKLLLDLMRSWLDALLEMMTQVARPRSSLASSWKASVMAAGLPCAARTGGRCRG